MGTAADAEAWRPEARTRPPPTRGPLWTAGLALGTPRPPPAAPGQLPRAWGQCPQTEPQKPPRRLLSALPSESVTSCHRELSSSVPPVWLPR